MGEQNVLDVYTYSGSIERGADWKFVEKVAQNQSDGAECLVIMCSGGGSPDAAYKMARYLQLKYGQYSVLVSGMCKSAATLFAIGASEVVFCPFGELGPLDIQLQKEDKLSGAESGLNISEAFSSLENRAKSTFNQLLIDVIQSSGGVVTFKTASEVATGVVSALYSPIFSQIEPEEVGSRARAMRIGEEYARRLNISNNLKPHSIQALSTHYAAHSFVIDYTEAITLFNNVRLASDSEISLVEELGMNYRFPVSQQMPVIGHRQLSKDIEDEPNVSSGGEADADTKGTTGTSCKANGKSSSRKSTSKST